MREAQPPRRIWRSIWAVLAGFLAVIAVTLGTDLVLHALGVYPAWGQPVTSEPLMLATFYRVVYGIGGSHLTARLAPYKPMKHALIGGAIGVVISTAGAALTWNKGPAFGPHWYPVALIITAMPCAWAGGKLRLRQLREAVAS